MKVTIKIISKIIIAVVFIFSGFVKCVDPTGTAIKMEEYLLAFGIDFMIPLSLGLSILMCGAEMLVGIMLLLNLKIKWAIWITIALMVFYTPLTLWLAISNKVTDCGCFGDALVLTNWQTFLKNVVLDVFIVVLFINRGNFKNLFKPVFQTAAAVGFALLVTGFEFYNLNHLPVIDFMPYKIGANIPAGMIIPDDAPQAIYKIIFCYEKNGTRKSFTDKNLPDSTWKFVKRKDRRIQKDYSPPIHDFSIITPDNLDVTNKILSDPGYSYLLIISNFQKANLSHFDEINRIAESAVSKGYGFYALTSSVPEEHELFKEKVKASYPIYLMDETTLKTMIRSNPGLILIKNGTIIGKWHYKQLKNVKDS
ncbi:MAG: DoxX family membrane protein [Porphyromonadaceae bacterium]|nr:MAG: DoxX family membrane protein [Porphyromonadaceae bacterium]